MNNCGDILRKILTYLLIAISVLLIAVNIREVVSALTNPEPYHFGHEMFWEYRTQATYITYCAVRLLYLLTALVCSMFVKRWKRVAMLFAIVVLYFVIDICLVYIF